MAKRFTFKISWTIVIAWAMFVNCVFAYSIPGKADSADFRRKKPVKSSYLKNGLPFALPPVKPGVTSYVKFQVARPDDKLLTDVEVFPNPVNVTDQLNLKYSLSRNSNVTIKIMDVLGNEILTVFQQRVELGDQKVTYSLNNKLTRGFYFVRIAAGTESVIKRISVL